MARDGFDPRAALSPDEVRQMLRTKPHIAWRGGMPVVVYSEAMLVLHREQVQEAAAWCVDWWRSHGA